MFKKSLFICALLSISGLELEAPSCLPSSDLSKMLQFAGAGLVTGGIGVFFSNDKPKDQAPRAQVASTEAAPTEESNNDEEAAAEAAALSKQNNRRLGMKTVAAGTLVFLASQAILPNKSFKARWTAITYLARNSGWAYVEKASPFTNFILSFTGITTQLGITT